MTISLSAISNIMFYQNIEGRQIDLGPLIIDPALPYICVVTGVISVIPSVIATMTPFFIEAHGFFY